MGSVYRDIQKNLMSFRDHSYALDCRGLWVNAKLTSKRKHQEFFCDCPTKHKMKLVKPSGLTCRRAFEDYFAHIPTGHKKSKKDSVRNACYHGGESLKHRMAKHKLRELVGNYRFPLFYCQDCRDETIMDTTGCSVDIEVVSADKKWRYDCLLKQESLPVAALEVVHTHLTGSVKAQSVRDSGLAIAEFCVEDVMAMSGETMTKLENLKMQMRRCESCLIKLSLFWISQCWSEDISELLESQKAEYENYMLMDKARREREAVLIIWRNAARISNYLERCQEFIRLNIGKIQIKTPLLGSFTFSRSSACAYGVMISGFSTHLPTNHVFIFLVNDASQVNRTQWKNPLLEDSFHVFLHASTVLSYLGSPCEDLVTLNDCRWPILKSIERQDSICAACGKHGHDSATCFYKFCVKCGRKGHTRNACFARRDVLGHPLCYH